MKLETLGEAIASRTFAIVRQGCEPAEITVLMGKPQPFPGDPNANYYCPYEIMGAGYDKIMAIGGVDAFQAMQLALGAIGVELEMVSKKFGGRLVWDAGDEGDWGCPVSERNSK